MRRAGILMPITSLPSPYGIGTMGEAAREFVRFLHKAGQSYWQILPICPTSYGDSPYQSFSSLLSLFLRISGHSSHETPFCSSFIAIKSA